MYKTTNRQVKPYVNRKSDFTASNLSGENYHRHYIVYSYGYWPLYVYSYDEAKWYENTERYSVTTSRHRSQSRPDAPTTLVPMETLKAMINARKAA